MPTDFGLTNYAFSIGDKARDVHQPQRARGAFACGLRTKFSDIHDGISNTIAMGEIGNQLERSLVGQIAIQQSSSLLDNPKLCLDLGDPKQRAHYKSDVRLSDRGRGGCWADGSAGFSIFNTILPPNSPSCAVDGADAFDGLYSMGSLHTGGGNSVFLDGAVRFITDKIDAGKPEQPTLDMQQLSEPGLARQSLVLPFLVLTRPFGNPKVKLSLGLASRNQQPGRASSSSSGPS